MEEKYPYYTEEPPKNSPYHKAYLDGIDAYLKAAREPANERRRAFITPQSYQKDPEGYRQKLCEMLGYPLTQPKTEPKLIEKRFVVRDANVNIYRIQLLFWDTVPLYGLYFEQTEDAKNRPLVIGVHGGGGTPELCSGFYWRSANYHQLVRRMTDRGVNVFAPQLLLWKHEEYGTEFERLHYDGKLRQLGGSITALELYLVRGCIDYFIRTGEVCAEKIGTAGLSYGGKFALHLAAIDPRIKACYSCSWVSDEYCYSWADWSYYNAQSLFGTVETAAMIAPRALTVAMGDHDKLFLADLTRKACDGIAEYYRVFDREDRFLPVIFEGDHELDQGESELDFLINALNESINSERNERK